jgi:hypothetical protein
MASTPKRSFASFVSRVSEPTLTEPLAPGIREETRTPLPVVASTDKAGERSDSKSGLAEPGREGEGPPAGERTRIVTSTGRVRTYTASRGLPGVTLRLTEERWERLKLLSIQERRPIQEILGEAVDSYMRNRGLRW